MFASRFERYREVAKAAAGDKLLYSPGENDDDGQGWGLRCLFNRMGYVEPTFGRIESYWDNRLDYADPTSGGIDSDVKKRTISYSPPDDKNA